MERFGSKKLAKFILNWHLLHVGDLGMEPDDIRHELSFLGTNWDFLGAGMYRHAYYGPDGFVYKVDNNEWSLTDPDYNWIWGNNAGEWQTYKRLHKKVLSSKLRLAKSYLWTFGTRQVMCQEFVNTDNPFIGHQYPDYECECDKHPFYDGECMEGTAMSFEDAFGLDDLHSSNLWPQRDGTFVACDFAGS